VNGDGKVVVVGVLNPGDINDKGYYQEARPDSMA
jgi:hypothetical protein